MYSRMKLLSGCPMPEDEFIWQEDERLYYEDWLFEQLTLHGDGHAFMLYLTEQNLLEDVERRFMREYIAQPRKTWRPVKRVSDAKRINGLRDKCIKLNYAWLTQERDCKTTKALKLLSEFHALDERTLRGILGISRR